MKNSIKIKIQLFEEDVELDVDAARKLYFDLRSVFDPIRDDYSRGARKAYTDDQVKELLGESLSNAEFRLKP